MKIIILIIILLLTSCTYNTKDDLSNTSCKELFDGFINCQDVIPTSQVKDCREVYSTALYYNHCGGVAK